MEHYVIVDSEFGDVGGVELGLPLCSCELKPKRGMLAVL